MPVREWPWHATSVTDVPEPAQSQRARRQERSQGRLLERVPSCSHKASSASLWKGGGLRRVLSIAVLSLPILLPVLAAHLYAQAPAPDSEPTLAPAVPDPLEAVPSLQERLLAPVPQQFQWLERETPSNPLLEGLLALQEPSNLVVTASLTEEVSDNFVHSPSTRKVDFRTGVALGTVYRLDTGRSFVSLANTVRAFYETRTDRTQVGFANLVLNAGYQLPPWSFGLTERLERDDGTAQNARTPLLRMDQNFIRNSISPQVRYDISRNTAATFTYTNIIVVDEDRDEGRTTHRAILNLRHQFSPNLNGNAAYAFTTSQGSGAAGGHSHRLTTEAGYTLDPDTTLTFDASVLLVERSTAGGQDSRTYSTSIGARRVLFSNVRLLVSVGPTLFQRADQDPRFRATWNVSLDGPIPIFATPTLTLTLTTSQRLQDTVGEVNDVGLVLRQLVAAQLNYTPSALLTGRLFAEYSRNELLEDAGTAGAARGRTDNLLSAGITASYTLTRIISLSGSYRYQRRESNTVGNDFEENRVTVAVTGRFPIF